MVPKRSESSAGEAGFIIVPVLWIMATLATLAIIYSLYVREAALNFVSHDEHLQSRGACPIGSGACGVSTDSAT